VHPIGVCIGREHDLAQRRWELDRVQQRQSGVGLLRQLERSVQREQRAGREINRAEDPLEDRRRAERHG
jgi:hypothetical protein